MRTLRVLSIAALAAVALAPIAAARGGGPGGGGGGMGGGFGGGFGGMMGGFGVPGAGGGSANSNPFGNTGLSAAGLKHLIGKRGSQGEQALADLEDRKNLIAERRKRLAESDREANQELRLAADRVHAISDRLGDDVR